MKIATSILLGNKATPELAAKAISIAMNKADIKVANSVLLLLTSEFANNPLPAIRAAAKAANCTQIMGCSAYGIFTEEEWVLDSPAAAVMVFGDKVTLSFPNRHSATSPLLTLTAPNAINSTWLQDGNVRFGGVSGDAIGQGHFSVWQNAKGVPLGRADACFEGVNVVTKASHGLKILTRPDKIQRVNSYDLVLLENLTALSSLKKSLPIEYKSSNSLPLTQIMAIFANSPEEIQRGEFNLTNLISYDEVSGNITLAQPLQVGQYLSWGLRDKNITEADLLKVIKQLREELNAQANFGLLFSCIGRGPFYDGIDHDLKIIKKQFPHMPLLGFYGNGQIASIMGKNQLLSYSAVLSLFSEML